MPIDNRLANISAKLATLRDQLNAIISEVEALNPPNRVFDAVLNHLITREGFRTTVYRDSLGIPTVGVGHVVQSKDNLKVGDAITIDRVHSFLDHDARNAFAAADQMVELGLNDFDFLVALTSVNFQLGTNWFKKFPKTWTLMKARLYKEASIEVANSNWYKQTPVRVKDFQEALEKL